jgi:hypothetical protein
MISIQIKKIKLVSVLYLTLPIILFFITWLKPIFGIIFIVLFLYSFYHFFNSNNKNIEKLELPYWQVFSFLIVIFLWVFISGSGGMGLMSPDHTKSNAIYKDILTSSWPVSYKHEGKTIYLATYLAYYLPMPVLFGWLKWKFLMIAVALWTYLGISLGLFWFCKLVNSFSPLVLVFFILVCGWDIAGLIHNIGVTNSANILKNEFFEHQPFWAIITDPKMLLFIPSNTHTFFWSPQHAISGWLASGLFFYEYIKEKNNTNSAIYLALLPFWSPFVLVGLLPFYFLAAFKQGFLKYLKLSNFSLIPIAIVLYWFVNSIPMGSVDKGFIFYKQLRMLSYFEELKSYAFFVFFVFLIWAIPTYLVFKKSKEFDSNKILLFSIGVLMLIPLYKLGKYNDFVQRVSIPALFILQIMIVRAFVLAKKLLIYRFVFCIILVIGSWDPLYFILLSLKVTNYKIGYTAPDISKVPNYVNTSIEQKWPIYHSFAPDSASFFKFIAR